MNDVSLHSEARGSHPGTAARALARPTVTDREPSSARSGPERKLTIKPLARSLAAQRAASRGRLAVRWQRQNTPSLGACTRSGHTQPGAAAGCVCSPFFFSAQLRAEVRFASPGLTPLAWTARAA